MYSVNVYWLAVSAHSHHIATWKDYFFVVVCYSNGLRLFLSAQYFAKVADAVGYDEFTFFDPCAAYVHEVDSWAEAF